MHLTLQRLFKPSLLIPATTVALTHWFRPFSGFIRHDPQRTALSLVTCMHCCALYPLQVQRCSSIEGKLGSGYWRPGQIHNNSTMLQNCSCTSQDR